jgi:hypothetical protein
MEQATSTERRQLHTQFCVGQRDHICHLIVDKSIILKADLRETEWNVAHCI